MVAAANSWILETDPPAARRGYAEARASWRPMSSIIGWFPIRAFPDRGSVRPHDRIPTPQAESAGPALLHDSRQRFVCADRRVLKLPSLLPWWGRSLPLELPSESSRKRSCDDAHGVPDELGILFGGFRERKPIQLRVDVNRLHATII